MRVNLPCADTIAIAKGGSGLTMSSKSPQCTEDIGDDAEGSEIGEIFAVGALQLVFHDAYGARSFFR